MKVNTGPAKTTGELIAMLKQFPDDTTFTVSAWDGTDYLCVHGDDGKSIQLVG
jgi:hypothetical protein